MTDFQTGIITLMKCAVTGEKGQLPVDFSMEAAEKFAAKQSITTLVYEGAVLCGISPKEPAMQRLFLRYVQLMLHSEKQLTEAERIFQAFEENGIDYLPLKGCNMKKLYPKPELRYMGDADILIRTEQYDRTKKIMEELGFEEGHEYYHEYHWHKADVHIELHKALIPSTSHHFYGYWGIGWNKAIHVSASRYALSDEDDFLFQFTHFAKHYMGPGIGCRYLLDLWMYLYTHPELDDTYLAHELKKLKLLEFYQNIQTLLTVWFEGKETDGRTDFISDYTFSGSSWGTWQNGQVSLAVKNRKHYPKSKVALILERLFPSLTAMTFQYPVLKKYPFLLPVYWLRRILCDVWIDPGKRRRGLYFLAKVSGESVVRYKTSMQYVGLDFEEE